jgi:hypothetical protein
MKNGVCDIIVLSAITDHVIPISTIPRRRLVAERAASVRAPLRRLSKIDPAQEKRLSLLVLDLTDIRGLDRISWTGSPRARLEAALLSIWTGRRSARFELCVLILRDARGHINQFKKSGYEVINLSGHLRSETHRTACTWPELIASFRIHFY